MNHSFALCLCLCLCVGFLFCCRERWGRVVVLYLSERKKEWLSGGNVIVYFNSQSFQKKLPRLWGSSKSELSQLYKNIFLWRSLVGAANLKLPNIKQYFPLFFLFCIFAVSYHLHSFGLSNANTTRLFKPLKRNFYCKIKC